MWWFGEVFRLLFEPDVIYVRTNKILVKMCTGFGVLTNWVVCMDKLVLYICS